MADALNRRERERYSRHLALPGVGLEGQLRLKAARVLVVGAGGLGAPVASYLVAAGVGHLTLVEHDEVDASNLPRQLLYDEADVGEAKLWKAVQRLRAQNPHVTVHGQEGPLAATNALSLIAGHDLVVDASDNFPTRYLVHDAAWLLGIPSVFGSLYRFEGQVTLFVPGQGPCFRCLFPHPPAVAPDCATGGVLGPLPGLIGTLQATEALKHLLGIPESLVGRLLLVDSMRMGFDTLRFGRDPACILCGDAPTLRSPGLAGVEPPEPGELSIAPDELTDGPWEVLDVREHAPDEIPGARHLPYSQLARALPTMASDRPYLLLCDHGTLALKAARLLRGAGLARAHALDGGIRAYRRIHPPEDT